MPLPVYILIMMIPFIISLLVNKGSEKKTFLGIIIGLVFSVIAAIISVSIGGGGGSFFFGKELARAFLTFSVSFLLSGLITFYLCYKKEA